MNTAWALTCPNTSALVFVQGLVQQQAGVLRSKSDSHDLHSVVEALHMAAATGRAEICQLLLIHGPSAANKATRECLWHKSGLNRHVEEVK